MDNNNKPPEPNLNIQQDESNKTYHANEGELVLWSIYEMLVLSWDML